MPSIVPALSLDHSIDESTPHRRTKQSRWEDQNRWAADTWNCEHRQTLDRYAAVGRSSPGINRLSSRSPASTFTERRSDRSPRRHQSRGNLTKQSHGGRTHASPHGSRRPRCAHSLARYECEGARTRRDLIAPCTSGGQMRKQASSPGGRRGAYRDSVGSHASARGGRASPPPEAGSSTRRRAHHSSQRHRYPQSTTRDRSSPAARRCRGSSYSNRPSSSDVWHEDRQQDGPSPASRDRPPAPIRHRHYHHREVGSNASSHRHRSMPEELTMTRARELEHSATPKHRTRGTRRPRVASRNPESNYESYFFSYSSGEEPERSQTAMDLADAWDSLKGAEAAAERLRQLQA